MSAAPDSLLDLRDEMHAELVDRLLPFWLENVVDNTRGGFVGRVDAEGRPDPTADRGGVLNARILWTFSAATRCLKSGEYAEAADRAFHTIENTFWDREHGGIYWMVDADGAPIDARKHVYAQAFAIYGLAEYHRATGNPLALERAVELYSLIEDHARDHEYGGYFEAFDAAWNRLEDVRLSEKDLDAQKSTNTHLHLLEAYAGLLRTWHDESLTLSLTELIKLFAGRVFDRNRHVCFPFFDRDWTSLSRLYSFGHDIETSWLLLDAAAVLPSFDRHLVEEMAIALADKVAGEGMDADGGMLYTANDDGIVDSDKHWWAQAEGIVGFLNAWQITGDKRYLDHAASLWRFIQKSIVDPEVGEWFERVRRDGSPYSEEDRVHAWKCPYHSVRACLEVLSRTESITAPVAL
jgi:cellobiose epimerase